MTVVIRVCSVTVWLHRLLPVLSKDAAAAFVTVSRNHMFFIILHTYSSQLVNFLFYIIGLKRLYFH